MSKWRINTNRTVVGTKPITQFFKRQNQEKKSEEPETKQCKLRSESVVLRELQAIEQLPTEESEPLENPQAQQPRRSARKLPKKKQPVQQHLKTEPCIKDLSYITFKGKINYLYDFNDIAFLCDQLLTFVQNSEDTIVPIGFDLEWPFSFKKGNGKIALAQICLNEEKCHLLRLYDIKKLPASFIQLLSNPKVKLVGISIKSDITRLAKDFPEFPGGKVAKINCLDCGVYLNSITNETSRWSLEKITAHLLKKRLCKDAAVRGSKWNIHPLSDVQKNYAATDAYVSLLVYQAIKQKASTENLPD